jgi:hypothetical protein
MVEFQVQRLRWDPLSPGVQGCLGNIARSPFKKKGGREIAKEGGETEREREREREREKQWLIKAATPWNQPRF